MNLFKKQKCLNGLNSKFCAVLGAQWGDEGKGKLIDILAEDYDVVARFNGGANAGHTIKVDNKKFFFHQVPSGILRPDIQNVVGNGCVISIFRMLDELKQLEDIQVNWRNRLFISSNAHMTLKGHCEIENLFEQKLNIGTTKKGIGTTYATKALRFGLRFEDLMNPSQFETKYEQFYQFCKKIFGLDIDTREEKEALIAVREQFQRDGIVIDTEEYISEKMKQGKRILAEGANGAYLDIDHGTYPFVTSSNTTAGGICTGLGVSPSKLETIIGIVKAYTTRVGEGPFPTELKNEVGDFIQKKGAEVGVTTGRKRRCGWLDLHMLKRSALLNGYSSIMITKLDVLSGFEELPVKIGENEYKTLGGWAEDISKIRKYEDLPMNAKQYLNFVEEVTETPISWIGVGPERDATIQKI